MGRENAEKVQSALYRIAELASAAQDLPEFYRAIHEIVGELMYARNFYITLYDEERQLINWPYHVDESGTHPDPNKWYPLDEEMGRGATAYVLRTGKPELLRPERFDELVRQGEIELRGAQGEDWLGVPLNTEGATVGVLVVQSYTSEVRYTEQDRDLLAFVGQHVGSALSRARAIEETRQRNAELALINSVQEAIAGELDQQAIYDIVGEKLREVFDAQAVDIAVHDENAGILRFVYQIERGVHFPNVTLPVIGFRKHVMETQQPLAILEGMEAACVEYGNPAAVTGEPSPHGSAIFQPLVVGGRPTGVISIHSLDREHAFDEADQRLLATIAGSLGVALDNAQLVHETRQRNAELALINSVQSALAGELEMQAIYDVVGEKVDEIFDAQGTCIALLDEATGLMSFPFLIERGERLQAQPTAIEKGFSRHVLHTGSPLMINEDVAAAGERFGSFLVAGEWAKSLLFVPLFTSGKALGVVSLENYDREHAFDEADQRLLTTLAGSLSVALENARLVHETRQRNAELALINSVQEALAGELEMQAIYDAVGDRIRDVFDAQGVFISVLDQTTGLAEFPYVILRDERLQAEPVPLGGFSKHVLETRESLLIPENFHAAVERYGSDVRGEEAKSALFVPLVTGGKGTGVISLQNVDREHAFGESDQQLLETLAGSLSVALENARLVHETRQRNAELALINSVQEALAGELEMQAIYDVVGDKIQEIFDAQVVDIGIFDFAAGLTHYPYTIERGVRFPDEPVPMQTPTTQLLFETKAPVLISDVEAWGRERGEPLPVAQGEPARSVLIAPLISGEEIRGRISLQNLDRTNAFDDDDVRLLTTLASSLSVALENARLVHETRQRNAELALINSVQDAIAGELDDQAIYDAVGENIREIFDAQAVQINTLDEGTGLVHFPYLIERGERLQAEPQPPGGFTTYVLETRQALLLTENLVSESERYGARIPAGEAPKSVLFVPLLVGGKAIGAISLQNLDREHAFGESDKQLLETLAGSLSVALENARLVHETRQRNAELAVINSVQEAIAGELDTQAIYDAVGDRIQEI
ncbi:MAG TPA: GAF domain-containing protein, partial [Gaiellaceae bacterium]|nr:GAF domain-containing protein [Gaiellaceae bacterium]